MEYEIDETDGLLDPSTNPSLVHRPRPLARRPLASRRPTAFQKGVIIPEEEEQLA